MAVCPGDDSQNQGPTVRRIQELNALTLNSDSFHTTRVGKRYNQEQQQRDPGKLTCFSNKLSPVESWSVIVLFSVFSKGLARISAIQISTCVCKKLFHVYLKNMSYKKEKRFLLFSYFNV